MLIGSRCNGMLLSPLVAAFLGWLIIGDISPGLCDWPEGTYGIPAHRDGCPSNDGVYQWRQGSILQKTEYGSHTSGSVNLLGMSDGPSDIICQTFCMKMSYFSSDRKHFMPGKYCILKLNQCPGRFQEGWIYWDDAGPWFGPTIQNSSGILPDGEYNRNTRIEYCCRLDGDTSDEIVFPVSDPFYLLKYGDQCQEVLGMDVVEEWVYWAGEKSYNLDEERGVYPKVERQKSPYTYTKLFYCYYTSKPRVAVVLALGSWFETFLMVLYIVGTTLGIVFLVAIILATILKTLIFRNQRCQQEMPLTDVGNDIIAERQMKSKVNMKGVRGNYTPEYSSCIAHSKTQNICLGEMKDSDKKNAPAQTVDAMDGHHSSVDSISINPDAESEAPPSYDEVLRNGNLNFIV